MASTGEIDLELQIDSLSPCFQHFPYNPSGLLTDHGSFIRHINICTRLPEDKKSIYLASFIRQAQSGQLSKDTDKCSSPGSGTDSREQSQDVYLPPLQAPAVEISVKSDEKGSSGHKPTSSFPVSSSSQPESTSQSEDSTHQFDAKQSPRQPHYATSPAAPPTTAHTIHRANTSAQPSTLSRQDKSNPINKDVQGSHAHISAPHAVEHTPSSKVTHRHPSPAKLTSNTTTGVTNTSAAALATYGKRIHSSLPPHQSQPIKRNRRDATPGHEMRPPQPRPQVTCCAMQTDIPPSPTHQGIQTDMQPSCHALHIAALASAVQSRVSQEAKQPRRGIGRLKQLLQQGKVHKGEGDAEHKRAGSWTAAALAHYLDSSFCYLEYCCLVETSDAKQARNFLDQTANLLGNTRTRAQGPPPLLPPLDSNPRQALLLLLVLHLEVVLRMSWQRMSASEHTKMLEYLKRGGQQEAKVGPSPPAPAASAKPQSHTYHRPSPGDSSASTQDTMDMPASQAPPSSSQTPSSRPGATNAHNPTPSQIYHVMDSMAKIIDVRTHAGLVSASLFEAAMSWQNEGLRAALLGVQALGMPGSNFQLQGILHLGRQMKRLIDSTCQELAAEEQHHAGQQHKAAALGGVEMMEAVALKELS